MIEITKEAITIVIPVWAWLALCILIAVNAALNIGILLTKRAVAKAQAMKREEL